VAGVVLLALNMICHLVGAVPQAVREAKMI